jgi:hypothetical protein
MSIYDHELKTTSNFIPNFDTFWAASSSSRDQSTSSRSKSSPPLSSISSEDMENARLILNQFDLPKSNDNTPILAKQAIGPQTPPLSKVILFYDFRRFIYF